MKKGLLSLLVVPCLTACGGNSVSKDKPSGKEVTKAEFKEKVADVKYAKESHLYYGAKITGDYSYEYIYEDDHAELNEKITVSGWAKYSYSTMDNYKYVKGELEITHTKGGQDVKTNDDVETARNYLYGNLLMGFGVHCLYDFLNLNDPYVVDKLMKDYTYYVDPIQIASGYKAGSTDTYKAFATFDKEGLLVEATETNERNERASLEKMNDTPFKIVSSYHATIEYL